MLHNPLDHEVTLSCYSTNSDHFTVPGLSEGKVRRGGSEGGGGGGGGGELGKGGGR